MFGLFNTTAIPALEQTAAFSHRRHELLAGNLANMDTPEYRARDLSVDDFQTALADSIRQIHSPSPGHRGSTPVDPMTGAREMMDRLVYHDGSDVNMERQVTEMAKNQHLHNTAVAVMRNQFGLLRAAISERV